MKEREIQKATGGIQQVGEGLNTISQVFPPLPAVEFDGQRLSLHNPPTAEVAADGDKIDNDEFRGERDVAGGGTQQRIVSSAPKCVTSTGDSGRCIDLNECPILLADIDGLRKSICFKTLFVPGVCCPDKGYAI